MNKTGMDGIAALPTLRQVIGQSQRSALGDACRGEERQWFKNRLVELADHIANMPQTYAQDGLGDQAIVHLHYFAGGSANWWITERDSDPDGEGQIQAFGLANMFGGPTDQDAELGYISIAEIIANHGEIDLHFTPCTLASLKQRKAA